MNPEQVPQNPTPTPNPAPAPQPQAYPPQPAPAPVPQPGVPVAPVDPNAAPQPAPQQPVGPAPEPQPIQPAGFAEQPPVAGPAPIAGGFAATPAPAAPKSPLSFITNIPKKTLALIGGGVAALIVLIVAAIIFVPMILGASMPLTTYENDQYSILIPEEYELDDNGDSISVESPEVEGQKRSVVTVSAISDIAEARDMYIENFDKTFEDEDAFNSITSGSDATISGYKFEKTKHDGLDARRITATVTNEDKKGTMAALLVYGEDDIYIVMVGAYAEEAGLVANAGKIVDSFNVK